MHMHLFTDKLSPCQVVTIQMEYRKGVQSSKYIAYNKVVQQGNNKCARQM